MCLTGAVSNFTCGRFHAGEFEVNIDATFTCHPSSTSNLYFQILSTIPAWLSLPMA